MRYYPKIYRGRIMWSVMFSALTSFFFTLMAMAAPQSIENVYILSFFYSNDPETELAMILCLLLYFVLLCLLTGIFTDDLQIQITYCFTRKKNITKWYFSMIGLLACLCTIIVATYTLCSSILLFTFGNYSLSDLSSHIGAITKIIALVWLFVFCVSFFINVISLIIKKKYIMPFTVVVLSIFAAILPSSIKSDSKLLVSLNPVARLNASLHVDILSVPYFDKYVGDVDVAALGLHFWDTAFYFFILSAIAFFIGLIVIKKTDIAMKSEE